MKSLIIGLVLSGLLSPLAQAMDAAPGSDLGGDDIIVTIDRPIHTETGLPFSPNSEEEGNAVCKYLGYERSAAHTMEYAGSKVEVIHLDLEGKAISVAVDTPLTQIVCIGHKSGKND